MGANFDVEIDMQILRETEAAILATCDTPENAVWLPKSKIEVTPTGFGGIETVTMPEWLAEDKGLI